MTEQSASIRLSTEHKGRARRQAVWIGRYRVAGKDSARVLGKAWIKRSRAPDGYLTRSQAEEALRRLLVAEGAALRAAQGVTFGQAADSYLASLEARIRTGSFRASTLRTYANIIEKELRPLWGDRPIAGLTPDEITACRAQLASRNLAASTLTKRARPSAASSRSPPSDTSSTTTCPRHSNVLRRADRPPTRSASIRPRR